jgi:hypothetical protein
MIKDVDGGDSVNTLIQKLQKKMGQVALDFSGEARDERG